MENLTFGRSEPAFPKYSLKVEQDHSVSIDLPRYRSCTS